MDDCRDYHPSEACSNQKEKRTTMTDKKYMVDRYDQNGAETLEDAIAYAQKRAVKNQESMHIYQHIKTVVYPVPELEVIDVAVDPVTA